MITSVWLKKVSVGTELTVVQENIPVTLISDNMAGHLMSCGEVDLVIVGADRIAANGDTANKIGTYTLAVLAKLHGLPFYVAAPISTFDARLADGSGIPIEERPSIEVTGYGDRRWAPQGISVRNPAFDVTPADLISAIITEHGVLRAPAFGQGHEPVAFDAGALYQFDWRGDPPYRPALLLE